MRFSRSNPKLESFRKRPDLKQMLHYSPIQLIAAPPTHKSSSGPSAQQLTSILRKEQRTLQNSDTFDSESSSGRRSKRKMKKQRNETIQLTDTKIQDIQQTHGYWTEIPVRDKISLERHYLETK